MAIWSLTQDRVDKLLKQIGDKEVEIDSLIKLSPKDIWNQDLDSFINEWHAVLADDEKTRKKFARMGRRTSQKLGIGGNKSKGRKKKAADDTDDDGSDSDFAIAKPKKGGAKSSTMLSYLNKPAPKPSASANLISAFSQENQSKLSPTDEDGDVVMNDGASDIQSNGVKKAAVAAPATKGRGRPAASKAKTTAPKPTPVEDDYDEDDVFAAVAKEDPAPTRAGRAVTKKPAKYVISDGSDDDDNGDSLLDVSHMVKGIGGSSKSVLTSRPLFSESAARPGSGHAKPIGRPSAKNETDTDDDIDQTDFTKLIPQPSPRKITRPANEIVLSDEDEDDFLVKPKATKVAVKPASKATAKPVAAKKAPGAKAVVAEKKKALQISPAAKAYLLKQQKLKATTATSTKPSKSKKALDDEEGDDSDAIVNDLLSDKDESLIVTKKKAAPAPAANGRGRPGRAAASKPAKYVVSDDESEEQSEEPSFDDDDSE